MEISLVIPCRNAASTLAATLGSVRAQTLPPAEVIVVDDASGDNSPGIAQEAGARVIRHETRRNAGGARNTGIEAAGGEALAFLDADVLAPPDWLARVVEIFDGHPEVIGVGGRVTDSRRNRYALLDLYLNHSEWILRSTAGPRRNIPTMAIVYRRVAIGPVRFPESNNGEDTAFALGVRARGSGTLWYDPGIVVEHHHQRLNWKSFRAKQVDGGRTIYLTRSLYDRPGKLLVRHPSLLFLFPHLWMVLARMLRAGRLWQAFTLAPWLFAGEVARIAGFFEEKRVGSRRGEHSEAQTARIRKPG